MSRKIFQTILTVTLSVLLTSLTVVMAVLYSYFTEEQLTQLKNETVLAEQAVIRNGTEYLDNVDHLDFRITWITADGNVLFDNEADKTAMENHLAREEIQEALQTGYGQSRRTSLTTGNNEMYVARRLPDGTVLRMSDDIATMPGLIRKFLMPLSAIVLAAFILSFLLASRLSNRIVKPLNELNLNELSQGAEDSNYAEIRPLLKRIGEQHRQILHDTEELEKASLIRQEFTANASHELKTPLHVISGYAELLESGMVRQEDIPMFAGKIRAESQRMSQLVEDIIDLSRLDAGGDGMKYEKTDLYRIAQNAVESLQIEADEANVTVNLSGSSAEMEGIPHILYSIVYNLCANAIKYNNAGGSVEVVVENKPEHAVLRVKDNGIGIPQEDLDRIFERFYRVDKSHSKEVGGTGLGLSIVKHAAKIHNADIKAESELGKGSEFILTFPKRKDV